MLKSNEKELTHEGCLRCTTDRNTLFVKAHEKSFSRWEASFRGEGLRARLGPRELDEYNSLLMK
jgi:hypothetical protein